MNREDYLKTACEAEKAYLASYRMDRYEQPSVTTDVAAFTVYSRQSSSYRKDPRQHLAVLLVKRGVYPFKGWRALPGGFLKSDETVEECAAREIGEETGVTPRALLPVGVFSNPDRDPRGRIISHAFACVIAEEQLVAAGDDADEASWFDVSFDKDGDVYRLTLTDGRETLSATLSAERSHFGKRKFTVLENKGLAFDHAVIIATAVQTLRDSTSDMEIVFEFLPEKFTLAALQKAQETIMNISLLSANFRRKIAEHVVETDEYTEGAGHRPAKLFTRKEGKP